VQEFKTLVRELHRAGIEVFLDVVFNHTGEHAGWPEDPVYSFRGLDNSIYYMLDPETGQPRNYSGCGNTLNCNHPVVRNLDPRLPASLGDRDARGRLSVRSRLGPGPG